MALRIRGVLIMLVGAGLAARAAGDLDAERLAMLQDTGGWEYLSMNDRQNGFPRDHTCFDGTPHPDACSGTLTLTSNNNFVQKTVIDGQTVARRGTYELAGDQLSFFDEFGTRDGPYTINLDTLNKTMNMDMPQVKVKLMLYSEYKKQLEERRKKKH